MNPVLILDGRAASAALLESLKPKIAELDPKLVVVQVGEDPASTSYIRQKVKSCESVSMRHEHRHLPEETSFDQLMAIVEELNHDDDVSGFIVQVPLPSHLKDKEPLITRAIDPAKDVDGFTAYNLGKVFLGTEFEHLPPATPGGIVWMLHHYGIEVAGKHVVIVGRSNTVGKPLGVMLLNRDATVTMCHSKTRDLRRETSEADILIAAVGRPKMITADMVKEGAVVVDVGINRILCHGEAARTIQGMPKYELVGDVDFDAVKEKVSAITPVPGGVGPMTVASLIKNCVQAAERQKQ